MDFLVTVAILIKNKKRRIHKMETLKLTGIGLFVIVASIASVIAGTIGLMIEQGAIR